MTNQTIYKPSPTCKTCKGTGTKWFIDQYGEMDNDICECCFENEKD